MGQSEAEAVVETRKIEESLATQKEIQRKTLFDLINYLESKQQTSISVDELRQLLAAI